ncbi:hypothetical protein [Glycomyces buryatensis]|uniref:Uncharacterized protein n=1 Tax=Glycomyces buryatensis TaxID=2570927 RepID=A0A4S8PSR1_9ACTN|nr:hypothetical protein [Glycomyces buryatensis]THV34383.1 hypothetical protein FAB82_24320 [Glycomyces buryatensis]
MLDYLERRLSLILERFSPAHRFGPHALSPFPVVTGRVEVPDGCGTIRFTSKMIVRASEPRPTEPEPGRALPPKGQEHRLRRRAKFYPVVLVNGIPTATGLGTGRIVLPAGRHLVQVQSLASGRYWPVDVVSGKEVRLASVVAEPYFSGDTAERMRRFFGCFSLGPRAFLKRWQSMVGPTAAAVAVYCLLFLFVSGPEAASGPIAAVATWFLLALTPWAKWAWHRLRGTPVAGYETGGEGITWRPVDPGDRLAPEPGGEAVLRLNPVFLHDGDSDREPVRVPRTRPPEVPMGARPLEHPHENPDAPLVEVLGQELEGMGRWAKGEWGMLVRDMGWDREYRERLADARKQESAKGEVAPWIEPPRITLGDRGLLAIWGRNEYRLPPGRYRVEIAIPGPPHALDRGTKVDLLLRGSVPLELDLRGGTVTEIDVYALVKSRLNPDGMTLGEYSGRIWIPEVPPNARYP